MTGRERETPAPGSLSAEPGAGVLPGLQKVRAPASVRLEDLLDTDEPLPVVVEVAEHGYQPPEVDVRAAITDTILTATVRPEALAELDRNPGVVAIEISRPTGLVDRS